MNLKGIRKAEDEARRFLEAVKAVRKENHDDTCSLWGTRHTAALRRASLDLTRALSDMRRA